MTTSKTTRRAVMAGIAASAAVPVLGGKAHAAEPDPVYAAIEAHKAADRAYIAFGDSNGWGNDETEPELTRLRDVVDNSAIGLVNTVPTTFAGVAALLHYVTDHDASANCAFQNWPDDLEDETVLDSRGRPLHMPFHCWLLRSVREALPALIAAT